MNNFYPNKTVYLTGYGAIGKCFTEMLLKNSRNVNLVVYDLMDIEHDPRFKYEKVKLSKSNIENLEMSSKKAML